MTRYADIDKVLEIINEVNADGGFTSYANYTYLFDSIDSLPTFEQPNWILCIDGSSENKRHTKVIAWVIFSESYKGENNG